MNNSGEGEDRATGEAMAQNQAEAAEGQNTEVTANHEDGDHDAPQPQEEQARGETGGQTSPQPSEDRETGDEIEELDNEDEAAEEAPDPQPEVTGSFCCLFSKGESCLMPPALIIFEILCFGLTLDITMLYRTIGDEEIESLSLGIAMFNIAGVSVGIGLAQTFNTLVSQTYGCGNMKRIGVMLQRALLFAGLICFFSWSVLIYTEPIALLLNRTPQVARDAQLYSYIMIPAVPCCFLYQLQAKFLQNQKILWPQLTTAFCMAFVNWGMLYVLVYKWELGVVGTAASTAVSHFLLALALFTIIISNGLHKMAWPGWTKDCLQEWGSFSVTAFSSVVMLCAELWVFEAWVFFAGTINKVELKAQRIVYKMYIAVFTFPIGIAETAGVRVGNAVGAKEVKTANKLFWAAVWWSMIIAAFVGLCLWFLCKVFGPIYTKDLDVLSRALEVMPFFAFIFSLEAISRVVSGVIRGAAKVQTAAVSNFASYAVGLALGLAVTPSEMGIIGYGTGIFFGVTLQATFYLFIMYNIHWPAVVKEARVRAGILMGDEIKMIQRGPGAPAAQNQPVPVPVHVMVVGGALSWKQAIWRRVLALCVAVAVLVVASVGRVFVMKGLLEAVNATAASAPPLYASPATVLGE